MTTSTHVYGAVLQPGTPLRIKGGRITLDEAAAPHVQATLTIAVPAQAVLAVLDPRLSPPPRVTITASAAFPWTTQKRAFDLTVRGLEVRHAAGEVTLTLSSDESLLQDTAPLADDLAPFSLSTSLRGVAAYVLSKIGATLQPGGPDANVRPYTTVTNLIPDPSVEGGGGLFTPGYCTLDRADASWAAVGTKSLNLYAPTQAASYANIGGDLGGMRLGMQAGRTYMLSASGRVKAGHPVGGAADVNARRLLVFWKSPGDPVYTVARSDALPIGPAVTGRVSVRVTLPSTCTEAFVRAYLGHAQGEVQWDAFRLSEDSGDPADTDHFDGSTPAVPGLAAYGWTGAPNASASTRTALVSRSVESLLWKAGTPALDFLGPLVQAAGLRLVCDERRRWTLRDDGWTGDGALAIRHAVNLIDASDAISRSDKAWFDGCVVEYTWTDPTGATLTATDSASASASPSRVIRLERSTPYPGPGLAAHFVAWAQARGRGVTATTVADWTAAAEQPVQIVLDGAPTQIGKTSRVDFDLDRDEMTITTRTTDTPASAWALIPTGQRWIDSPVGASWTSEVI